MRAGREEKQETLMYKIACFSVALVACYANSQFAVGAISGTTRIASGLNAPVFASFAPGDNTHMFVLEKDGAVKVVDVNAKTVLSTNFLTINDTDAGGEGGLLGLAFHPGYNQPTSPGYRKFYIYVTVDNGGVIVPGGTAASATSPYSTHIRQYTASSNPLIAETAFTPIMDFPRPQENHVGGWIGFGPKDGYLYINSGDGGAGYDQSPGHFEPAGNAQTLTNNLLGKQLRIDVNSDAFTGTADPTNTKNYAIPTNNPFVGVAGDDEIWSYGLRNPYRSSFDRITGDQWIADVGQDQREEIDFEPASRTGVSNFGWRLREGDIETPWVGGAIPPNYVAPVYDYEHGNGAMQGNAVIGGYRYRGPDPSVTNAYFFADSTSSHYWRMNTSSYAVTNIDSTLTPDVGSLGGPAAFAEDGSGNLFIVAFGTGSVFRINTNQLLPGDYNADGSVNNLDYAVWRSSFGTSTGSRPADGNGNGVVDSADYVVWRNNLGSSVFPGAGSAIPEPSAAVLLYVLAAVGLRNRRISLRFSRGDLGTYRQ